MGQLRDAGSIWLLSNWSMQQASFHLSLLAACQQCPLSVSDLEEKVDVPSCWALPLLDTAEAAANNAC